MLAIENAIVGSNGSKEVQVTGAEPNTSDKYMSRYCHDPPQITASIATTALNTSIGPESVVLSPPLTPLLPAATQSLYAASCMSTNACPSGLCFPSSPKFSGFTTGNNHPSAPIPVFEEVEEMALRVISALGRWCHTSERTARRYTELDSRTELAAS